MALFVVLAPAANPLRDAVFDGYQRLFPLERTTDPVAIVVISILCAALHIQYDWTGILQIFVIGLFLGWMRWRSGSTLLTLLLVLASVQGVAAEEMTTEECARLEAEAEL